MSRPRTKPAKRRGGTGSKVELTPGVKYRLRFADGGTQTFYGSAIQADERLDEHWLASRSTIVTDNQGMTVGKLTQQYMDTASAEEDSPTTHANKIGALKRLVLDHDIANVRLDRLSEEHVESWQLQLIDREDENGDPLPPYAWETYVKYRAYLTRVIEWGVERRKIGRNPATNATRLARRHFAEGGRPPALTREQTQQLIKCCTTAETPWGPLFIVGVQLGMRPGEVLALRWSDVHLDQDKVSVDWALNRPNNSTVGFKPTKTGAGRKVDVPTESAVAFKRMREQTADQEHAPGWDGLVFPLAETGAPPRPELVHDRLWELCEEAEVPAMVPYSLRHTSATIMLDHGAPYWKTAERLGTSVRMLEKTYGHPLEPISTTSMWDELMAG